MNHGRKSLQHIQDPSGKIPEDEPVFLLRGQDRFAVPMLSYYASLVARETGDQAHINAIYDHAHRIAHWQSEHGSKTPDLSPEDTNDGA